MRRTRTLITRTLLALGVTLLPATMSAQQPPQPPVAPARSSAVVCRATGYLPSVQLVSGQGTEPWIADSLLVRERRGGAVLYRGSRDDERLGGWLLMEQRQIAAASVREGLPVFIEIFEHGKPPRRIERELGLDRTGCHVVILGDPLIRR